MKKRTLSAAPIQSSRRPSNLLKPAILGAAIATVVVAGLARPAMAANDTWTGSASGNWSDAGNWTGGNAPPLAGDALTFDGATNTGTNNNLAANTQLTGITFAAGASSFTLAGNAIVLNGAINDNSPSAQSITLPILFDGGTSSINVAAGGSLTLGTLTFGPAAATTNVSTLNVNSSVSATSITARTSTATANVLNVAAGQTLTVSNGMTVGGFDPGATAQSSRLNVAGNALNVTAGTILVGGNSTGAQGLTATLDLSGLNTFSFNGTELNIGGRQANNTGNRSNGTVTLASAAGAASSNTITATTINVGAGSNSNAGGANFFNLAGVGTNTINADSIVVGMNKSTGTIQFAAGSGGTLTLRNKAGTGRANLTIGSHTSSGTVAAKGTLNLSGHTVDVLAGNLIVGQITSATTAAAAASSVQFDAGTFDVTSIVLGQKTGTAMGTPTGTFTISGGSLLVNSPSGPGGGTFVLGNNASSNTALASGAFNVNGGVASVNTDITLGTATGGALVNIQGGTLDMMGHNIGSASLGVVINPGTGTLKNVSSINGAGGLIKNTTGTFTIDGINSFVSSTVNNGTLSVIGSHAGSVTVNNGTLAGTGDGITTGRVADVTVSGGDVHPGTAAGDVGMLTTNNFTLNNGSLSIDLGTSGTADVLNVLGNLTLGASAASPLTLNVAGILPAANTTYEIIDYAGALTQNAAFTLTAPIGFNYALDFSTAGKVFLNVTAGSAFLTWNGAADGTTWNASAANFSNGTSNVAFSDGQDVVFNDTAPASATTVNITANVAPSNVVVNASTNNYTFTGLAAITGAAVLIKDGSSSLTVLNNNTYSGTTTITNGTLQVGNGGTSGSLGSGAITNNGVLAFNRSDSVEVSNNITGSGSLQQLGSGTLVLTGSNSYGGPTTISAGTLQIGNGGAAGTLGTGAVTNNGTLAFNRSDNVTVPNVITGTGGVSSLGPSVLTLSGANTFTGPVNVAAGSTLRPTVSNALGATTGTVGAVSIADGAMLDLGGNTTANGLTFGTRVFKIKGAGVGTGKGALYNSGTATQNAAFNFITLDDADATVAGSRMDIGRNIATGVLDLKGHTLTTTMSGAQPLFGILSGVTVTSGFIVVKAGTLDLERSVKVLDDGTSTITYETGTNAEFFETTAGSVTRKLIFKGGNFIGGGSANLATVNSNMELQGDVTLEPVPSAGPSLTANNPLLLAGNISGPFSVTKAGVNTTTLSGSNTYSGATTVTGGTLVFGSSFTTSSGLNVSDGAVAQLTTTGNKTLKFGTLNLNSSGKLDLGDGRLVLSASDAATLVAYIQRGYAGGAWTGNGLMSTSAQAAADPNHIRAIGWAIAGDAGLTGQAWGAVPSLSATDLIAKLTYFGDINLNGKVDADDYALMDRGLAKITDGSLPAGTATWLNGDVNYDGTVDANDFLLADTAFGLQTGTLSPEFLAQREARFGPDYVSQLVTAVPEPSSLAACGLVLLPLTRRRRTR